jgi:hypothetical protein
VGQIPQKILFAGEITEPGLNREFDEDPALWPLVSCKQKGGAGSYIEIPSACLAPSGCSFERNGKSPLFSNNMAVGHILASFLIFTRKNSKIFAPHPAWVNHHFVTYSGKTQRLSIGRAEGES